MSPESQPDVPLQLFPCLERSVGDAVDAHKLGRYALPDLGVVVRFAEDGQPGMRMKVDEPGTDDVSAGVNDPSGLQPRNVAPVDGDGIPVYYHRGVEPRTAAAVYDHAVLYD